MFKKVRRYCYNLLHPAIGEVWQLHRVTNEISDDVALREYEITPDRLVGLIEEYLQKGYHFVSVNKLHDMLRTKHFEKHFVVVTLDDGYEDNFRIAYPIFKRYNIPFCIFVTQKYHFVENLLHSFLTEQQIRELGVEPLCTLGCHTLSHRNLTQLSNGEQKKEISTCKEWLETLIYRPVKTFTYPYGAYNLSTIEILKLLGIEMAFAAWGGPIRKNVTVDIFQVPRLMITQDMKK